MTYREKLMQEYPNEVDDRYEGGCHGCPSEYGYEEQTHDCPTDSCTECWDREIPSEQI